jgi:2-hydroxychromene-2-carboxylate isomerase
VNELAMTERRIEFFFDIGSPYSFLAATRLDGLARRTRSEVQWKPLLLGGVFKAVGSGPPVQIEPKARHMLTDLRRWSHRCEVDLRFPSRFPLNTLKTQRALVAVGRGARADMVPAFALALFRAYWCQDRDVSDEGEIARIATEMGLDGEALVSSLGEPEVKDRLRELTDDAVRRGAFGAPTFFVGDEMFFGNDRLDFVEEHLRRAD